MGGERKHPRPARPTSATEPVDRVGGQYFGGDLMSFRAHSGLRLSEVGYERVRWPEHTHGTAFFAFLLRGRYAETFRSVRLCYRPFDLGFHPEATRHNDEIGTDGTKFFLIEMEEALVGRLREHAPTAAREPQLCGLQDSALAARLYREHRAGAAYSPLKAEGLVLEMLSGLAPVSRAGGRPRPRWLRIVADFLQSEHHRKLSLDQIARQVNLHPVYLSRSFRAFTGQSVSQYLTGARIRFALRELADPEKPLSEIALGAGFCDQSHFTRVFKRETGMTPGAFRGSSAHSIGRPRRTKGRDPDARDPAEGCSR